jgi:ribonucleotide reductase beta subunit family protein with ferritin-like domain
MPGLTFSNELISRDEGLHTMFAMYLYTLIPREHQLSASRVTAIVREAVNLGAEFIHKALPVGMPEMNAGLMLPYIECTADSLVALINMPPIFGSKHNFAFMEQINLIHRTNFFERHVSDYAKPVMANIGDFDMLGDF